ncbi:ATP-binding cassette-type vacuolar membrane transporter-like protein Hmt1 [Westerdykella ornata]|uniref:ATP-binding cassette-type vacuolar membrane transporter-like protein Hmt1 n=1 Tax=Westerdykella ornata TaxID=318751 RepID=A0A6A6J8M5_WESOR|nr:ATP-binding cassette-type vacuolar membrane transporter-like protein Hmt1 [Westerdykella ornata]KAF2271559.1 ATP-binding cassette-type vacuolar membrane transporter-like protein Hmt1 [Westerdykella ornata]
MTIILSLHEPSSQAKALDILGNVHGPLVGALFWVSTFYGFVKLHRPIEISRKKRAIATTLVTVLPITYVAEVLYYFVSWASGGSQASKGAINNCLWSILFMTTVNVKIFRAEKARWFSCLGAFVLEFALNTTILCLKAITSRELGRYVAASLIIQFLRTTVSLALVIQWLTVLPRRAVKLGTDEEGQSLLSDHANGSPTLKKHTPYGTVGGGPSDTGKHDDRDMEIKKLQAERIEKEGGWVGYLKTFAVFLPHLWPTNDRELMIWLCVRGANILLSSILQVLTPRQLGIITDKLSSGITTMPWLDIALWLLYSFLPTYAGFGALGALASIKVRTRTSSRIQLLAFAHVMDLSMDFHANKATGEVIKAVEQATSLNRLVETVLFEILPMIINICISVWYVTHLFDLYFAYIIICMSALYVTIEFISTAWSREHLRLYRAKCRAESQISNESLHNWHTVFYFNRGKYETTRFNEALKSRIMASFDYQIRRMSCYALSDGFLYLAQSGCYILAIHQIVKGWKPVGNLVTFIMYWYTIISPVRSLAFNYRTLTENLIDAERLVQLLSTKPSVADAPGAKPLVTTEGKVVFDNVGFSYDERKPITRDVSLIAEGGQTIALVGETGGGKSTLLKLLARAYDAVGGSISIDGQDIRSVTRSSLRDAMGLVPQSPELFNIPIRENVRYGRLDATDEEVEDACRAAAIHDTIVEFPDGYDSLVGERGVKLSGGQLQRVAIARVLLRDPSIVLLDEATSAVDSATEELIQKAFRKLCAGKTTFVIAHRLSTIVEADQILLVSKGEIVERGSHDELLAMGGKYAEFWNKQSGGQGVGECATCSSTLRCTDCAASGKTSATASTCVDASEEGAAVDEGVAQGAGTQAEDTGKAAGSSAATQGDNIKNR